MVWWLRELYAAGERPTAQEIRRYLRTTHPRWQPSDRIVVERWSKLLRNPMHEFRLPPTLRYRVWPFHHVEDLIIRCNT